MKTTFLCLQARNLAQTNAFTNILLEHDFEVPRVTNGRRTESPRQAPPLALWILSPWGAPPPHSNENKAHFWQHEKHGNVIFIYGTWKSHIRKHYILWFSCMKLEHDMGNLVNGKCSYMRSWKLCCAHIWKHQESHVCTTSYMKTTTMCITVFHRGDNKIHHHDTTGWGAFAGKNATEWFPDLACSFGDLRQYLIQNRSRSRPELSQMPPDSAWFRHKWGWMRLRDHAKLQIQSKTG